MGLAGSFVIGRVFHQPKNIASAVNAAKTELNTAINKKADSSAVPTLTTRVGTAESEIDDLQSIATRFTGEGSIKSYIDTQVASDIIEWGTI